MDVIGIDFTSTPRRAKPITAVACRLAGQRLTVGTRMAWTDFAGFETKLNAPGPWIAGLDFPFGQARRFIETIGWPRQWTDYVAHAHGLGRAGFRAALDAYRAGRAPGDKEHRRRMDAVTGAISPQKLYGVPVGLMFFEGAPRLIAAGVHIPHMQTGDPNRIAVEAYPGVLARSLVGRRSYKTDTRAKQTDDQHTARRAILAALRTTEFNARFGFTVDAPETLAQDPTGDSLDAMLCAVQAAWAWTLRDDGFGAAMPVDPLEGWIADPSVREAAAAS